MAERITNSDLMKEVRGIHKILEDHENRLRQWEQFKIAYDAADAAVAKYKQEHTEVARIAGKATGLFSEGINKDFVNIVLKFLGVVTSMLGILYLLVKSLVQ